MIKITLEPLRFQSIKVLTCKKCCAAELKAWSIPVPTANLQIYLELRDDTSLTLSYNVSFWVICKICVIFSQAGQWATCFLIRFPRLRQPNVQKCWPDWIIITVSSYSLLSSIFVHPASSVLAHCPPNIANSPTTPSLSRFGHRSRHVMAERVSLCLAHTSSLSRTAGTEWNKRLNKGFGASKTAANDSPTIAYTFFGIAFSIAYCRLCFSCPYVALQMESVPNTQA